MTLRRCSDTCSNFLDKNLWWIKSPQFTLYYLTINLDQKIITKTVYLIKSYIFNLSIVFNYTAYMGFSAVKVGCFTQPTLRTKGKEIFFKKLTSVHPRQPFSSTPKWWWAHPHTHRFLSLVDCCLRWRIRRTSKKVGSLDISVEVSFR